jgi:hypothetical protein
MRGMLTAYQRYQAGDSSCAVDVKLCDVERRAGHQETSYRWRGERVLFRLRVSHAFFEHSLSTLPRPPVTQGCYVPSSHRFFTLPSPRTSNGQHHNVQRFPMSYQTNLLDINALSCIASLDLSKLPALLYNIGGIQAIPSDVVRRDSDSQR